MVRALRLVPTRSISCRPTAIVGRFPLVDSRALRILNMFDRGSRPILLPILVEIWPESLCEYRPLESSDRLW